MKRVSPRRKHKFKLDPGVRALDLPANAFERRLRILEAATSLQDLAALSSNHLEALGGDRKGQYSIRINKQWRICFEWPKGADGPENVEIVDYH